MLHARLRVLDACSTRRRLFIGDNRLFDYHVIFGVSRHPQAPSLPASPHPHPLQLSSSFPSLFCRVLISLPSPLPFNIFMRDAGLARSLLGELKYFCWRPFRQATGAKPPPRIFFMSLWVFLRIIILWQSTNHLCAVSSFFHSASMPAVATAGVIGAGVLVVQFFAAHQIELAGSIYQRLMHSSAST